MQRLKEFTEGDGGSPSCLTLEEIQDSVVESSLLSELTSKAKSNLYYIRSLERRRIKADDLLAAAIGECRTNSDLVLIAIALRYGANKNLYLQTPGIGPAHVLVYTVNVLRDRKRPNSLISSISLILLLMGSSTSSPAFDQNASRTLGPGAPTGAGYDTGFLQGVTDLLGSGVGTESFSRGANSPNRGGSAAAYRGTATMTRMTVQEWLRSQGYPEYADTDIVIQSLSADVRMLIGTICDKPDVAYATSPTRSELILGDGATTAPRAPEKGAGVAAPPNPSRGAATTAPRAPEKGLVTPNFDTVLLSRPIAVTKLLPVVKGLRLSHEEAGESYGIMRAVDIGFSELFTHLVDRGLEVSYFTMTRIILFLREAFISRDRIYFEELEKMLLHSISRGVSLDNEQMAIISLTDERLAGLVLEEYRRPYWKKVCSSSLSMVESDHTPGGGNGSSNTAPGIANEDDAKERGSSKQAIPEALRNFAFSLNLDPNASKFHLCSELERLSRADPDSLKRGVIARQRARAGAMVSTIQDYVGGAQPTATCSNKTTLQEDPFSYNDAQMSFYVDDEGLLWCFTSDMYQSMIANPVNPSNGKALPASFISQLKTQIETLTTLGIPIGDPRPITRAIDSLTINDEVSEVESRYCCDTMMKTAIATGIGEERFRNLNAEQMSMVMKAIQMDQKWFPILNAKHQFIVFCRAAYFTIRESPELSRTFFAAVTSQIQRGGSVRSERPENR